MAKSSSSWGHTLEVPTGPETSMGRSMGVCASGMRCPNRVWEDPVPSPVTGKTYGNGYWIGGPAVFLASYNYITGRAGRVGLRELPLCRDCAAKFAKNHKVEVPDDRPHRTGVDG